MAFCPKCGTSIPEGSTEKFCGTCGQPLQENTNPEATEKKESSIDADEMLEKGKEVAGEALEKGKEVAGEALEKGKEIVGNVTEAAKNIDVDDVVGKVKSGDKKTIGAVAVAAVAVVVVIALVVNLFGGKPYMDPINDYIKLVNKQSTDYLAYRYALMGDNDEKYAKKMNDLLIKAGADVEDSYEDYADEIADYYEDAVDEYGDFKLSFELKEAEKMDDDDLEDLVDEYEESFEYYEDLIDDFEDVLEDDDYLESFAESVDIDEKDARELLELCIEYIESYKDMKVQEVYEVKGKFIIDTKDEGEIKSDTVTIYMVKINGDWVYAGVDESIYFDDDEDGYFYYVRRFLNNSYMFEGMLDF